MLVKVIARVRLESFAFPAVIKIIIAMTFALYSTVWTQPLGSLSGILFFSDSIHGYKPASRIDCNKIGE